jgi:hypothetical protein
VRGLLAKEPNNSCLKENRKEWERSEDPLTHIRIIDCDLPPIVLEERRQLLLQCDPDPLSQFIRFGASIDRVEVVLREVAGGAEEAAAVVAEGEDCVRGECEQKEGSGRGKKGDEPSVRTPSQRK